jgi:hypothetical protein
MLSVVAGDQELVADAQENVPELKINLAEM